MHHTDVPTLHGQAVPDWRPRLRVRLVRPGEWDRWKQLMAAHHYLGFKTLVGPSARYVVTVDDTWVALLGWAAPALRCQPRDRWIGWVPPLIDRRLRFVANNSRFLILPGVRIPNLASAILAMALHQLADDWPRLHGNPLLLVETFVDPARFLGTIYRAAGWIPLGRTRGFGRRAGHYYAHGHPKEIWVHPLVPQAQKQLADPFVGPKSGGDCMPACDLHALNWTGPGGLRERLGSVTDPRHRRGVRHDWITTLLLAAAAILSGQKGYVGIYEWAQDLPPELRRRFGCRRVEGGFQAPSEPTFRRTLQSVNADEFDAALGSWIADQAAGGAVAVDGKTLRGSGHGQTAVHLLAALLHGSGLVVAQKDVGEKTNEIPTLRKLLDPMDLHGRVVTADALHTQLNTARYLVEQKGANYVLEVKGNQPTLQEDIQALDPEDFSPSAHHSRPGTRED
ncbi:MAG: ISAs1 family transposase [Thermaerobacter sp.]|nr:ISAs1 family transposase [Thermaerobacter sp.]